MSIPTEPVARYRYYEDLLHLVKEQQSLGKGFLLELQAEQPTSMEHAVELETVQLRIIQSLKMWERLEEGLQDVVDAQLREIELLDFNGL